MSRTPIVLSILVASSLATTLQIRLPATTAGAAFKELSRLTSETWRVDKTLENEVIDIQCDAVTPEDLREQLAKVLGGSWKGDGQGWTLSCPEALRKTLREAALQARREAISKALLSMSAPPPAWNDATIDGLFARIGSAAEKVAWSGPDTSSAAREALSQTSWEAPIGRALRRLLPSLSPSQVAQMRKSSVLGFSDAPNRLEQPLGSNGKETLSLFNIEQEQFRRALLARNDLPAALDYLDPRRFISAEAKAQRLLLLVKRFETGPIFLSLKAVNEEGRVLAFCTSSLSPATGGTVVPDLPDRPLVLKESAVDWNTILWFKSGKFGGVPPPPDLNQKIEYFEELLTKQSEIEPARYLIAEELEAAARSVGKDLVANIPDELLSQVIPLSAVNSWSLPRLLNALSAEPFNCKCEVVGNSLLIMPSDLITERANRLDRSALSKLALDASAQTAISIDQICDYAFHQRSNLLFGIFDCAIARLNSEPALGAASEQATSSNRNLLRFWGSLTSEQRTALRKGGSLRFFQLAPASREIAVSSLYEPRSFGFGLRSVTAASEDSPGSIESEPIEAFPNGIDPGVNLVGNPTSENLIRFVGTDGENVMRPAALGEFACENGLDLDKLVFKTGARSGVSLSIQLNSKFLLQGHLEDSASAWSDQITLKDLPADRQREIREAFASATKAKAARIEAERKQKIPPT